ncbi:iron complex outermembrane recepter protein [Humidesulfovibrio mexicanus]|uniref:Iron complex outermembrane recepter protein n=1 Tax=Humidesulfovibrio mexicanus TaxID=147047 RepID=A0A238XTG4_9BACT|nr:iron complex outermembrane recepter protein [Humidesulfovibrio mexicanus]
MLLRSLWLAPLLLVPVLALADDGAGAFRADNATEPHLLETVRVTATKREEELQRVPASVSALDETSLEQMGAQKLGEAVRALPNVHLKQATSGSALVIRGLSTIDTSLYNSGGLYVDGVARPLTYMQNLDLMDVERIEVLRGPQGTLYGRNSDSGVVNVVLRQPGLEPSARIFADYGSYNSLRTGASFSTPLDFQTLFLSGSLLRNATDGFTTNVSKNDDRAAKSTYLMGRGSLLWKPREDFDMTLSFDSDNSSDGVGKLRYETGTNASRRFKVRSNAADDSRENSLGQTLKLRWSADFGEVSAASSFRDYTYGFLTDLDRTAAAQGYSNMALQQNSWSQELRLASPVGSAMTWLAGVYAGRDDTSVRFDRIRAVGNLYLDTSMTEASYALFGQGTVPLWEGLRLTVGLRAEATQSRGTQRYATALLSREYGKNLDDTALLPTASLAYDFAKDVTAYATFAQGYLSGGYNPFSATDQTSFFYRAEHTTNYELGLKTAWLDGRLTANAALFHTEVRDKQVRQEVPGGGVGAWSFSNAPEAHVDGMEIEFKALPWTGWELSAGAGYAKSEVDRWKASVGGTQYDYKGKRLPWAPEITWNLGALYTHESGVFGRVDVLGAGKQYFDAENTLLQTPYQTVNLRLGYARDGWEFALWAKNVFDTAYTTKQVKDTAGNRMVEDGDPQTFGISAAWSF